MRILLTGKTGQLGGELAIRLQNHGEVYAPTRDEFDLCSAESMRRVLDDVHPNLIVNAAAYTAVDKAESDHETAMLVNERAPEIMAIWAAAHDAAILHYSTDYVFDGTGSEPYCEDDTVSPINVYGQTKYRGEQAIKRSGVAHLIVRTSWLYDADGSNFLKTILRLARERAALNIVDDQVGAPTPAWWLAEASTEIVSSMKNAGGFVNAYGGILHAATAGRTSWHGFAMAIVEGARLRSIPLAVETIEPVPTSAYPTPAARPAFSVFGLDRLRADFAVTPPHWRDALAPVLDRIRCSESGS
jgi:dTDP-4-dehydrorhamnose reductase